jgi:hypothetical protein
MADWSRDPYSGIGEPFPRGLKSYQAANPPESALAVHAPAHLFASNKVQAMPGVPASDRYAGAELAIRTAIFTSLQQMFSTLTLHFSSIRRDVAAHRHDSDTGCHNQ